MGGTVRDQLISPSRAVLQGKSCSVMNLLRYAAHGRRSRCWPDIIGSNASRQTIREISYRLVAALAPLVTAYSWNARPLWATRSTVHQFRRGSSRKTHWEKSWRKEIIKIPVIPMSRDSFSRGLQVLITFHDRKSQRSFHSFIFDASS